MIKSLLALVLFLLFVSSPGAHADVYDDYVGGPTLHSPLYASEVQIEGPQDVWAMRKVATKMDKHIDNLTIYTTGTCAERPQAFCVRVHTDTYDAAEMLAISGGYYDSWYGLTVYSHGSTDIYMNATWPRTRKVAAHEFGHALGLAHHGGPGVTGRDGTWRLSDEEADFLNRWFVGLQDPAMMTNTPAPVS